MWFVDFFITMLWMHGVLTCLFTFAETYPKYGPDRKCARTDQCVAQLTVRLVYPVKLHRSPTQNAWVSVSHTAAGSERDSAVVRMKHSYLYNQITVNTWPGYDNMSHTWISSIFTETDVVFLCWRGTKFSIVPVRALPLCSHMQEHKGCTWNCHYVLSLRCSRCPRCDPAHWNNFWEFWRG